MPIKIRVRDFQSLEDVSLDVDGLTVVTGANNTGKTALMRALRGAFQNAKGTSFIRHGASKTVVDLDFGEGQTLTWEKGRGKGDKPTYIVNGGSPLFPGQGVPDEIREFGVRPILAGGREVWPQLAPQFTGQIFLLDQSGSVMAEAVADVERVGQLNDALRMVASDKRTTSSELQVRRGDNEKLTLELKHFEGLDNLQTSVIQIESSVQLAQKLEKALFTLRELGVRYQRASTVAQFLSGVEAIVLPEEGALQELPLLQQELSSLIILQGKYAAVSTRVQVLSGIEFVVLPEDGALQDLPRLQQELTSLRQLQEKYVAVSTRVQALSGVESVSVPEENNLLGAYQDLTALKRLQTQYLTSSKRVTFLSGIETVAPEVALATLERIQGALATGLDLQGRLHRVKETILGLEQELLSQEAEEKRVSSELMSVLGSLETCPVCGSVTHLDH